MRTIVRILTGVLVGGVALVGGIAAVYAQPKVASERITFAAATARDGGATVRGELRLPEAGGAKLPAVVVLHTAAGPDATGDLYIEALNRAGIATLKIEMFPNRAALPATTRHVMPHAFGSLLYLAGHPRVDASRIGVIGFSYGGIMALLMNSRDVWQEYTAGKARFAAHVAVYPVCWIHLQVLAGRNPVYGANTYKAVTGAPVHILTGEKDDYDEPDTCPKLVAGLPADVRRHFSVTVYPGAYHQFDNPDAHLQFRDRIAFVGRGGTVTNKWDPETAAKSRASAVEFFAQHLAVKR